MAESLQNLDPIGVVPAAPDRARTVSTTNGSSSLAHLSISPEALRSLPAEFVKRNRILPYKIENGTLHIATDQPGNQRLIEDIRLLSALEVKESEAPPEQLLEQIAERFMPQDGHIQIHHRGVRVDIRVGTMPTIYGESLVMRLLEKNTRLLTPVELGLDPERSADMGRLVEKPHGLFLATGPTGSGKTTTLYSILQGIYSPELKI